MFRKLLLLASAQQSFAGELFPGAKDRLANPIFESATDFAISSPVRRWRALKKQTEVPAGWLQFSEPGDYRGLGLPGKDMATWWRIGAPLVRSLLAWAPPVVVARGQDGVVPVGNAFVAYMAWVLLPSDEPIKVIETTGRATAYPSIVLASLATGLLSWIVRSHEKEIVRWAPSLELAVLLSSMGRSTCATWRTEDDDNRKG